MSIIALALPVFKPAMRAVINITNAPQALVTTSLDGVNPGDHGYIDGLIVRIDMPKAFGMQQINQQFAPITVVTSSTFLIDIDTTHYDVFSVPTHYPESAQYCESVPFAELNSMLTGAVQNVLPY